MFCNQCEQVAKGGACRTIGVCGKQPDTAALQDLLIYALKGLSCYVAAGRKAGIVDRDVNVFTVRALFSTLTNVSFDAETEVMKFHIPPFKEQVDDYFSSESKFVLASSGSENQ